MRAAVRDSAGLEVPTMEACSGRSRARTRARMKSNLLLCGYGRRASRARLRGYAVRIDADFVASGAGCRGRKSYGLGGAVCGLELALAAGGRCVADSLHRV